MKMKHENSAKHVTALMYHYSNIPAYLILFLDTCITTSQFLPSLLQEQKILNNVVMLYCQIIPLVWSYLHSASS